MTAFDISSESKIPEDDPKGSRRKTQAAVRFTFILLATCGAAWFALSSADDTKRPMPVAAALETSVATEHERESLEPAAVPSALVANFHVDIRVRPAHAQILLDGRDAGRGHIRLELPRDGHVHEIRILADGYAPERLVFADASPQREVVLAEEREDDESPSARRLPRATPHVVRPATRPDAAPVLRERKEEVRKETMGSPLPPDTPKPDPTPSVRIIADEGPNVRVVE